MNGAPSPAAGISFKAAAVLACVFLAAHLALGSLAVRRLAPTYDEGYHLAVGYANFISGERWLGVTRDNPPGARDWAAVPLMLLRPAVFGKDAAGKNPHELGDLLLRAEPARPDRLLNICRLFLLWTLSPLLAWFLFRWAGEAGGPSGAAAAVFCLAFSPFILANAALTTIDMAMAVSMFASVYLFRRALLPPVPRLREELAAGAALGLALTVKYSAIALLPALPLAGAAYLFAVKAPAMWKRLGRATAAAFCTAAVVLALVCGWHGLGVYWTGLSEVLWKIGPGGWRPAYFLGQSSAEGFGWRFYVWAFLLKTPVPFLLALPFAARALLKGRGDGKGVADLAAFAVLPPALLFAAACSSKLQSGLRYVIAVYPFLFLLVGAGAARLAGAGRNITKAVLGVLAAWYVGAAVHIHPHYLAYFNELAGGPSKGYKYFVDSNFDWGQGLKELGEYVEKRGGPAVYLSYYGTADPHSYGIRYAAVAGFTELPRAGDVLDPSREKPLLFAISATNRVPFVYDDENVMAWLDELTPETVIGHTIFVYDLSGRPDALAKVFDILARQNNMANAEKLAAWLSANHPGALKNAPGLARVRFYQALDSARRGEQAQAAGYYRAALKIDPDLAEAHYNLALDLAGRGKPGEAAGHYREVIRIDPGFAAAHYNLGIILAAQGRREEAEKHYRQALQLDPKMNAPAPAARK